MQKIAALALIAFGFCITPLAYASGSSIPRDALVSTAGGPQALATIESGRTAALAVLKQANKNMPQKFFQQEASTIAKLPVVYPPQGFDFGECQGTSVLAYTLYFGFYADDKIYICAQTLNFDPMPMSLIFIHETGHVLGDTDECSVTRKELSVYHAAGLDLPYESAYYDECGIAPYSDLKLPLAVIRHAPVQADTSLVPVVL